MCYIRRIYFSCFHEDMNVTPPRPLTPCNLAIWKGSKSSPFFCISSFYGRRSVRNADENIIRDRPCPQCHEEELRLALDQEWHEFLRKNVKRTTTPDMLFYMEKRDRIFDNNYYLEWEQLHRNLVKKCLDDIKAKYGPFGDKDEEVEEPSSESSTSKQHHIDHRK
ncbi:hypothetical protein GGR53DRAFT_469327 [Hypoxylon sp. FL1150]|nr:hypothetical protein GGR53DRAFT_469327 [Hypoxylon sp. FL1150]